MSNNFLDFIDTTYETDRKVKGIPQENTDYRLYYNLLSKEYIYRNSFKLMRIAKTRILYSVSSLNIDFTDFDLIRVIVTLDEEIIKFLIQSFIDLYNDKSVEFEFIVSYQDNEKTFKGIGIDKYSKNTNICLFTDNNITLDGLIFMLNMVFTKDFLGTKKLNESNSENKVNLLKRTLVKYIILIKFYKFNDIEIKEELNKLNYPVNTELQKINYGNNFRNKINEIFDLKIFENYLHI